MSRWSCGLLAPPSLVGNSASRRVLEAAGMRLVDERMVHGALHAVFRHGP